MPERSEGGVELSEDGVELGKLIPDDDGNKDIHHDHCKPIPDPPPFPNHRGKLKFTKYLQIRSDQHPKPG